MYARALVRTPGPNCAEGITTAALGAPSHEGLLRQHAAYVAALRGLGLEIVTLDADPSHPDGYFVEDAAVVTPEVAVIARPGAPARRGEEGAVASALAAYRERARIEAPGTLEGGDVLIVGRRVYVGVSVRTNREGARQLAAILARYGYGCQAVPVAAGLHLKSSANYLGDDTVLVTESLSASGTFAAHRQLVVDPEEAYAANSLWVNGSVLVPEGHPRTRDQIRALGVPVITLAMGEVRKMDGGLTCLSIRF